MKPSVHDQYRVSLFRRLTGASRLLPDYLVLGAQKAGTTTLYDNLVRHSRVMPCDIKEVHFFDMNFYRGPKWYRAHFPRTSERLPGMITGEGSPYYLFHPGVPERVKSTCPHTRFLVILRDPVSRAFSHYQHEKRKGREEHSFEKALELETTRLNGQADYVSVDSRNVSYALQHYSYLSRGLYAGQPERWFSLFPREQFLVLFSDELKSDMPGTMAIVHAFLGLEPESVERPRQRNIGGYREKMLPETRDRLRDYFSGPDADLERLLGRKLPWRSEAD